MKWGYRDFLDDPNEYECPICGGSCTFREITADGIVGVACDDYDCSASFSDAGFTSRVSRDRSDPVQYVPPESFVIGEPERITLVCPDCGTDEIEQIIYDDGPGYVDVKLECRSCGTSTWQ